MIRFIVVDACCVVQFTQPVCAIETNVMACNVVQFKDVECVGFACTELWLYQIRTFTQHTANAHVAHQIISVGLTL